MSSLYHVYAQKGQSLFDIAMQEYGNIDTVFTLLEDNNISDITTIFDEETKLFIRKKLDVKPELVEYARNTNNVDRFIYDNRKPSIEEVWGNLDSNSKKLFINSLTDSELEDLISLEKRNKLNYILPVGNNLLASYADGDPASARWDASRHKLFDLTTANRFGNTKRFTFLNGNPLGIWNQEFMIDHAHGLIHAKLNSNTPFGPLNWDDAMEFAIDYRGLGYDDWLIIDDRIWQSFSYYGNNFSRDARHFWLNINSASYSYWSSVTGQYNGNPDNKRSLVNGGGNEESKSILKYFILCRKIKDNDNIF